MAFHYSPKIVTDGLYVCLDSANIKSYPETGTNWSDLTANRNNFSIVGSISYTASNSGSLLFNGGYAQINQNVLLSLNNFSDWSIEVWLYQTSFGSNLFRSNIFGIDVSGNVNSTTMYISRPGGNFVIGGDGATGVMEPVVSVSSPTISFNTWYQLVAVKNGTNIRLSINGVEYTSVTRTTFNWSNLGSTTAKLGNRTEGDVAFIGRIPIFRIYRGKSLSASEVLQNYNATKSRFGL
jgi:hypothetical protein